MKFKEFWIKFKIGNDQSAHQIVDVSMNKLDRAIHVIEKSAYDQAIERIKSLEKINDDFEIFYQQDVRTKEELQAKLKVAEKALDKIGKKALEPNTALAVALIAIEALGQIRDKNASL
jgi:hypothetical protein